MQGQYYRVWLDDTNRLLPMFVQYQQETVCLALEVIHQHAYEKSRFLRGAVISFDDTQDTVYRTALKLTPGTDEQTSVPLLGDPVARDWLGHPAG